MPHLPKGLHWAGASVMDCVLLSGTHAQCSEGPSPGSVLCCHHLEILNNFLTRAPILLLLLPCCFFLPLSPSPGKRGLLFPSHQLVLGGPGLGLSPRAGPPACLGSFCLSKPLPPIRRAFRTCRAWTPTAHCSCWKGPARTLSPHSCYHLLIQGSAATSPL